MLKVGLINKVKIFRVVKIGYYVGENADESILLPNQEAFFKKFELYEELNVFVYRDSEDRLIATLKHPRALLGEFVYLKVKSKIKYGYFLDYGIEKDILLPKVKISKTNQEGYVVRIELDKETDRLMANARLKGLLESDVSSLKIGDKVEGLIYKISDLGYGCIIENRFDALLYKDSSFALRVGDKREFYIKNIREDSKIDLELNKDEKLQEQSDIILKKLRARGGYLPFTYKSSPEEIAEFFGISRKAFKRVLTELIEANKIELKEDDGIYKREKSSKL